MLTSLVVKSMLTAVLLAWAASSETTCECGLQPIRSRIIGGRVANASEYPWMAVLVENLSGRAFCGATLINTRFVLTAAHCMIKQDESSFHVVLGENDITSPSSASLYRISRIYSHPKFSGPPDFANDLSLVELERPVTVGDRMTPVCLPQPGPTEFPTSRYGYLMVAGWGLLRDKGPQPKTLIEADVIQRLNSYCALVYGRKFTQKHICANSMSSSVCNGDSGGPLMLRSKGKVFEIGVVSYGYVCGNYRYPAAFTRTQAYLDWIFSTTGSGQYCPK